MTPIDDTRPESNPASHPASNEGAVSPKQQVLRLKLQSQRQEIGRRIDPEPEGQSGFPSSITMRFVMRHQALIVRVLLEMLTLIIGSRLLKSVSVPLLLARVVYSALVKPLPSKTSHPALPAPRPTLPAPRNLDITRLPT